MPMKTSVQNNSPVKKPNSRNLWWIWDGSPIIILHLNINIASLEKPPELTATEQEGKRNPAAVPFVGFVCFYLNIIPTSVYIYR